LNKFENFKSNIENQLKEEFNEKKTAMVKQMNEMKAKIYSQKCAENLKLERINKLKEKLSTNEKNQFQKVEKLERLITHQKEKERNNDDNSYIKQIKKSKEKLRNNKANLNLNNKNNNNNDYEQEEYYNDNDIDNDNNNNNYNNNYNENHNILKNIIYDNNNSNLNSPTDVNNFSAFSNNNNIRKTNNTNNNNLNDTSFFSGYNNNNINSQHNFSTNNNNNDPCRNRSINLFDVNKRLRIESNNNNKSINNINTNNNTKRDYSILLQENIPEENQQKTLKENLNDLIQQKAKLNSPLNKNINMNTNTNNIILKENQNQNINNNTNSNKNKNIITQFSSDLKKIQEVKQNKKQEVKEKEKNKPNLQINTNEKDFISPFSTKNNLDNNNKNNNNKETDIDNNKKISNNLSFIRCNSPGNSISKLNQNKTKKSISLNIENNIPISLNEFGKYLVKFIEKEENYRILYEKEIKKIKEKLKIIFDNAKRSDHCLVEYLTELWEKLEISYANRYRILMDFCKKNDAKEIYNILDKETEYITEYFKSSDNIFKLIKNREKIKNKLQIKSNRSK
jgi:hypothetical protein